NQRNISWGTPNGRIFVYGQLMEQLCQRSELLFTMLTHLDQYDEPKPVQNFEHRIRSAVSNLQGQSAEATVELLTDSPWWEDLEKFQPLVIGGSNWESPLVVLLKQNSQDALFRREL